MQNAFSVEFRRDVVAVARQSDASISQVARELGISEGCVHRWLNFDGWPRLSQLPGARRTSGSACWSKGTMFCVGRRCIWDGV